MKDHIVELNRRTKPLYSFFPYIPKSNAKRMGEINCLTKWQQQQKKKRLNSSKDFDYEW